MWYNLSTDFSIKLIIDTKINPPMAAIDISLGALGQILKFRIRAWHKMHSIYEELGLLLPTNFTLLLDWPTSSEWCCMLFWFDLVLIESVSSWLNASLDGERFIALYFPLRHRSVFSTRVIKRVVAFGLLSLIIAFPSSFYAKITLSSPTFGIFCAGSVEGQPLAGTLFYILLALMMNPLGVWTFSLTAI